MVNMILESRQLFKENYFRRFYFKLSKKTIYEDFLHRHKLINAARKILELIAKLEL